MHIFFFLVIIVLLIILISKSGAKNIVSESLLNEIKQLRSEVAALSAKLDVLKADKRDEKKTAEEQLPKQAAKIIPPSVIIPEKIIDIPAELTAQISDKTAKEDLPPVFVTKEPSQQYSPLQPPVPAQPQESWFDKWLRNNPDMEKFIGENLINKIGIAVLILGIAFFVRYAIDRDWINETGRVCIGLLCGGILLGIAHRLRKNYRSFSSVLVGGGLTVFYFTIAFAFHQYNLISQDAAFIIMIVITAFAVILSVLYDRIELAVLAMIGGFITPFLVSTGQGNYIVLFTYLCILNAGLIVLAFYKRWRVLNFIAFFFTTIIYSAWIAAQSAKTNFPYEGTFLYGTAFYLMFVAMNVIHHSQKGRRLHAFDFSIFLAVNLGYYGAGMYLLQNSGATDFKGLFTAGLGMLNLILAFVFFRRKNIDRNFIYLLIGVTLSYISLAAPVQLNGNYITLFWASEMAVLFWLYKKSFIKIIKIASALITLLTIISLIMDWVQVYGNISSAVSVRHFIPIILNKGFITTVACATAMSIMSVLLKTEADSFYLSGITNKFVRKFYTNAGITLFFLAGVLEIDYQFSNRFENTGLQHIYLQLYIMSFFVLLYYLFSHLKIIIRKDVRLVSVFIVFLFYMFNMLNSYQTEKFLLTTGQYKNYFIAHWISIASLLLLFIQTIQFIRLNKESLKSFLNFFSWIMVLFTIITLSVETRNIYIWLTYSDLSSIDYAENLYGKAGLSIVWGLSSFILIWLGMRFRFKTFRIIALILFGITLIKLFAFDIRNIPPGGKIVAFILLGVLLLIVSFMYQRLKKLLIDDTAQTK